MDGTELLGTVATGRSPCCGKESRLCLHAPFLSCPLSRGDCGEVNGEVQSKFRERKKGKAGAPLVWG